jgi:hypothetical protein
MLQKSISTVQKQDKIFAADTGQEWEKLQIDKTIMQRCACGRGNGGRVRTNNELEITIENQSV